MSLSYDLYTDNVPISSLCLRDFQLQGGLAIGGHVAEEGESVDGFTLPAAGLVGVGHAASGVVQVVVEVVVGDLTAIHHGGVPPVLVQIVVVWHLVHHVHGLVHVLPFHSIPIILRSLSINIYVSRVRWLVIPHYLPNLQDQQLQYEELLSRPTCSLNYNYTLNVHVNFVQTAKTTYYVCVGGHYKFSTIHWWFGIHNLRVTHMEIICATFISTIEKCASEVYIYRHVVGVGPDRTASSGLWLARAPLANVIWWDLVRNHCIGRSAAIVDSRALESVLRRSTNNEGSIISIILHARA